MTTLTGLLETALFVDDLDRACEFYERVLALPLFESDGRGCVFGLPGGQVLLVVQRGVTAEPHRTPGGVVPPCGASGPQHLAFAIPRSDLDSWRNRLDRHQVEIESEVEWERGGRSLYFRDPDGHLLELATPGVWDVY